MQIGVVGLGCIGANISRRRMKAGHSFVVWDANPAGVLSACLFTRFRQQHSFAGKTLSAMRFGFDSYVESVKK